MFPYLRPFPRALCCLTVLGGILAPNLALAADKWIEVKSPHFTVTSNASQGEATTIAWEFEQIRSAIGALWTWAHVDLNKPLVILAVKDENSIKALAPQYWEQKNAVHPASVWVEGADQNYLAIRTDVKTENNRDLNPYQQAYFSYVSLVMDQSLPRSLPLWFRLGFAGVVSNTVVRDQKLFSDRRFRGTCSTWLTGRGCRSPASSPSIAARPSTRPPTAGIPWMPSHGRLSTS